ncbi:anti-lipopolysaccharide factor-like [Cherax quadricarinatus]
MKPLVLVSVGVLVLVMVSPPDLCQAQETEALVSLLISKLAGLWHNDQVDFMGHICHYSYRPTISRWQLYYKGKMWCPGWAPFSGNSETRSRSGAVEHATRDFVRKALESNLITKEQAAAWLNN